MALKWGKAQYDHYSIVCAIIIVYILYYYSIYCIYHTFGSPDVYYACIIIVRPIPHHFLRHMLKMWTVLITLIALRVEI
jgi:hypothetical protein